jgi:hypothetical protein
MTDNNTTSSSNTKGIDIRQALEILSARGDHAGPLRDRPQCGCCEKPPNFASLGQTIQLVDSDNNEHSKTADLQEIEDLKKKVSEERAKRRNEIDEKLGSLNKEELIKCFFEAQEQRVQAYRRYDQ